VKKKGKSRYLRGVAETEKRKNEKDKSPCSGRNKIKKKG